MTIQPTVSFSFEPHCKHFSCLCCCKSSDDESVLYPCKSGKFRPVGGLSDAEVEKANERFREILVRKLDPLPLDTDDFLDRLEHEEGISLKVTRDCPLTKERLDHTVKVINKILGDMHID